MINWLIIAILIVLGVIVLKANHFRHRFWIFFLIFIAIFLYISITAVHSKYNLDFTTFEGLSNSIRVYLGWLGNGFQNMKALVGNAIKMDWTSNNKSLFDKTNKSIIPKTN